MELRNIYSKYTTDKYTGHTYLDAYEETFNNIKGDVLNILEIGVQYGGSMKLWNDLFEHAKIYGVDINPLPKNFTLSDRMTHIVENAYDVNTINKYFYNIKFDIIIDDGSHQLGDMIFVAKHYSKLLTEKGAMIIEDVQHISWTTQIINSFPEPFKSKARIVDNRHKKNKWDDLLVITQL